MTEPRKSVVKRGLALVALVMALAILASLGTWQAGRYLMRRDIFDRMEEHLPQAIVTVDSATDFAEIPEFRRVRLEGGSLALEHTGDVYSCDHYVEPAYLLGNITAPGTTLAQTSAELTARTRALFARQLTSDAPFQTIVPACSSCVASCSAVRGPISRIRSSSISSQSSAR